MKQNHLALVKMLMALDFSGVAVAIIVLVVNDYGDMMMMTNDDSAFVPLLTFVPLILADAVEPTLFCRHLQAPRRESREYYSLMLSLLSPCYRSSNYTRHICW